MDPFDIELPGRALPVQQFEFDHRPLLVAVYDECPWFEAVLPTGMLDFSFCIRYIRHLISTDVVALDGGGHHDVSTAQSSQNPAGSLPEPTTGEGVA